MLSWIYIILAANLDTIGVSFMDPTIVLPTKTIVPFDMLYLIPLTIIRASIVYTITNRSIV